MAVTRVWFAGISNCDEQFVFRNQDRRAHDIYVEDFNDGIVETHVLVGTSIELYAEVIAGCFKTKSNFAKEVIRAYKKMCGLDKDTEIKGIKFNFNDVEILVTKENANVKDIIKQYYDGIKAC